jgi:hypothetical protein
MTYNESKRVKSMTYMRQAKLQYEAELTYKKASLLP